MKRIYHIATWLRTKRSLSLSNQQPMGALGLMFLLVWAIGIKVLHTHGDSEISTLLSDAKVHTIEKSEAIDSDIATIDIERHHAHCHICEFSFVPTEDPANNTTLSLHETYRTISSTDLVAIAKDAVQHISTRGPPAI